MNDLQSFYNMNYSSYVSKECFLGLLSAVCEGLSKIPLIEYGYVASNLGYDRMSTVEEILDDLKIKELRLDDKSVSASTIDYFLRALGFILEKETPVTNLDVKYIANCLLPLALYKNNQEIVDKYAEL